MAGNLCVGSTDSGAPILGDECQIGYGVTIIGGISIANGCRIGAGAVVNRDVNIDNATIAGVPAKELSNKL